MDMLAHGALVQRLIYSANDVPQGGGIIDAIRLNRSEWIYKITETQKLYAENYMLLHVPMLAKK